MIPRRLSSGGRGKAKKTYPEIPQIGKQKRLKGRVETLRAKPRVENSPRPLSSRRGELKEYLPQRKRGGLKTPLARANS